MTLEEKVLPLEHAAVKVAGPVLKPFGIITLAVKLPVEFKFTLLKL